MRGYADTPDVFVTRTTRTSVAHAIETLPAECFRVAFGTDWIVAGPVGVFLVGEATDVHEKAQQLVIRANRIRAALAETMVLVPFVQALVVPVGRTPRTDPFAQPACTVVPPSMLLSTIVVGAPQFDEPTLEELRAAVTRLAEVESSQTGSR